MGMSTHIVGFNPPNDTFRAYKNAYDACVRAKVAVPEQVLNYFGDTTPDDSGIKVDIENAISIHATNNEDGYEVDITKLPKGVTRIRFFNSY